MPPASKPHQPADEVPPPASGHHHEVEQNRRPSPPVGPGSSRAAYCRELATITTAGPGAEHRLTVDDRMNHWRLEPEETSYRRKHVRKMIRWPTPI